jgi:hypothetical protein
MESLFETSQLRAMQQRIAALTAETQPLWGTMTAAQMAAHCRLGVEMATGELRPKQTILARVLGPLVKGIVLKEGVPMRRNTPTMKELVMGDGLNFEAERDRLQAAIDRFAAGGPEACTKHPHAFFGKLTPEQWSTIMWKHLDHHLRQFGV